MRDSVKRQYTREWIQYDRPQTMYDKSIQKYITELLSSGDNFAKDPAKLMEDFKKDMHFLTKFELSFLKKPPINDVKDWFVLEKMCVKIEVVVVFPWVPATANNLESFVSFPNR